MAKAQKGEALGVSSQFVGLVLTIEEANVLRVIVSLVGGHPKTTRRGFADNIRDALDEIDVNHIFKPREEDRDYSGAIYFKEARSG